MLHSCSQVLLSVSHSITEWMLASIFDCLRERVGRDLWRPGRHFASPGIS